MLVGRRGRRGEGVARGVYFTQVKYQSVKFVADKKLTLLEVVSVQR